MYTPTPPSLHRSAFRLCPAVPCSLKSEIISLPREKEKTPHPSTPIAASGRSKPHPIKDRTVSIEKALSLSRFLAACRWTESNRNRIIHSSRLPPSLPIKHNAMQCTFSFNLIRAGERERRDFFQRGCSLMQLCHFCTVPIFLGWRAGGLCVSFLEVKAPICLLMKTV